MIEKKPLSNILQFKNGKKRPKDIGTVPVYGGNGFLDMRMLEIARSA